MNECSVSNDIIGNAHALMQRAETDGYLFFKGLLDSESLLSLNLQVLDICAAAGWLASGSEPRDAVAAPGLDVYASPDFPEVYGRIQRLELFHSLAHRAELLGVMNALFDNRTVVHPRHILRVISPKPGLPPAPAHQDYIHIQGTEETWTAWMPLHDCPRRLGSLALLARSHEQGIYPVHRAAGAGGVGIDTEALPMEWVTTDFEAGDVVLFHSLLIHKGQPNLSGNRVRISVDYRYQDWTKPAVAGSFKPDGAYTWEELYEGWSSKRYQYYWQSLPIPFVDYSAKFFENVPDAGYAAR